MNCLDEETIEALVAGVLQGQAKADAAGHIRQCAACRESVRQTALLYRALGLVFAEETREGCPSGEELAQYDEGELDSGSRRRIERHLRSCVRCAADLHELRTEREELAAAGPVGSPELSITAGAIQIIHAAGASIPSIQEWIGRAVQGAYRFLESVQLACLTPRTAQATVLSAATGSGFQNQALTGPDSPFDAEMIQFGQEVHIALTAKPGTEGYADCLVRLVLAEGEAPLLTKVLQIKAGKGSCLLHPSEVEACVPDKRPLSAKIELVSVPQALRSSCAADAVEALVSLLNHADPSVRRSAVEILAELDAPRAADAISKLRSDPDAAVRAAAATALDRFGRN